jgi:transglutaminase-like putative cysteine protease
MSYTGGMLNSLMRSRVGAGLVGAVGALLVLACSARADSDRWYLLQLMGQKCGDLHTTVVTAEGKITTRSVMKIAMGRGKQDDVKISVESTFVETEDGRPVLMRSVSRMGAVPVTSEYTFKEDGSIELVSEQADQKMTQQLPKPEGVWLTPAAADRYIRQRMKSGAQEITVRTVDPIEGVEPARIVYTGFEKTTVEVEGREIEATKRTATIFSKSAKGIKTTEYVDAEGELIRSRVSIGGMPFDVIASPKEVATRAAPAPEVMVSTFSKPDKPIRDPRRATRAVLLLSVPGEAMPELPGTGSQSVEVVEQSARVTIDAGLPAPAPEKDAGNGAYLKATTMVNIEDERIKRLAERAVEGAGEGDAEKAEACRRFVHRFIRKKNLGVAFATASEIAAKPEGDCTEHGVLLAALLRANGIPSRGVVGLIYADQFAGAEGIFGYHMWTQALLTIDGVARWVDLDATLDRNTPYDATHITLDTTDFADGSPTAGLAAIATLLGRLEIKVESVEHAAEPALAK